MSFILLALADVLLKMAMGHAVRKATPAILDRLDKALPDWLARQASEAEVDTSIRRITEAAIGRSLHAGEAEALLRIYDPRKAVAKAGQFVRDALR